MDFVSLSETVKKSIEHYDNQLWEYRQFINNDDIKITDNETITFYFDNDEKEVYDCELLGYYDYQNNIWVWAWVLADFNYKDTPHCKYLLEYGLKLEPRSATQEQIMIKGILVNSRIKIDESIQLDINLSIYSYLVKDRIKFIYPRKKYLDKSSDKFVIFYYLIK